LDGVSVFDSLASKYDSWYARHPVTAENEVIAARKALSGARPCLEVGVGTGFFAVRLGCDFGVDPSIGMLRVARARGVEVALAREARERDVDGVICGHIHHAEMRDIDGVLYCNDGDWVESCTALAEDETGQFSIITWRQFSWERKEYVAPVEVEADDDLIESTPATSGVLSAA